MGREPGGAEKMARGEDPLEKGGWAVLRLAVGVGVMNDSQVPVLQHRVHREGSGGRARDGEGVFGLAELGMLLSNL